MSAGSSSGASSSHDGEDDSQSGRGSLEGDEMEAMSHVSDASSHKTHSMRGWAAKIHDKICIGETESLPVMSHRSAVNSMCQLRNLLIEKGGTADRDCRMLLLFSGISVQRRVALGSDGAELEDLTVSLALLFMLQVLCEGDGLREPSPEPMDTGHGGEMSPSLVQNAATEANVDVEMAPKAHTAVTAKGQLEQWHKITLLERMSDATAASDSSWGRILQPSPDTICRACIQEGARLGTNGTLPQVIGLATEFFRCSTLLLQYNMLNDCPEDDMSFLSLGSVDLMMRVNEDMKRQKLAAVADAGESEAGQQVLRDMILSFTLPQSVVGVRRTPLLGREPNRIATEQHTAILGEAHEAAMRGAEWSWSDDPKEVHKMCALLAGLCILLGGRSGSADLVRKNDAFRGRVQLPFLETMTPAPGLKRLGLIPHRNEWLVYTVDKKQRVKVNMKSSGFEGLCEAVLMITSDLQT